jgi:hypothetical protein
MPGMEATVRRRWIPIVVVVAGADGIEPPTAAPPTSRE